HQGHNGKQRLAFLAGQIRRVQSLGMSQQWSDALGVRLQAFRERIAIAHFRDQHLNDHWVYSSTVSDQERRNSRGLQSRPLVYVAVRPMRSPRETGGFIWVKNRGVRGQTRPVWDYISQQARLNGHCLQAQPKLGKKLPRSMASRISLIHRVSRR